MNEQQLKQRFLDSIEDHFDVAYKEKAFTHLVTGQSVRPDFVIRPKPELLQHGFDDGFITVEVKSPFTKKAHKHGLEMFHQAHTYTEIKIDGELPLMCLMYPPVHIFLADKYDDPSLLMVVHSIMQRMNVGGFQSLYNKWRNQRFLQITIGNQTYFRSDTMHKTPHNLLNRYVGNVRNGGDKIAS